MSDTLTRLHTSILDILLLYCKLQELKSFRRYAAPQVTCLYHVLLSSLITEKRTDCLAQVFSELFLVSRFRWCSGKKCDSTRERQTTCARRSACRTYAERAAVHHGLGQILMVAFPRISGHQGCHSRASERVLLQLRRRTLQPASTRQSACQICSLNIAHDRSHRGSLHRYQTKFVYHADITVQKPDARSETMRIRR